MENQKKVAIFDFDGTLVSGHLYLGLLKYNLKSKKNILLSLLYLIIHMALAPFWLARILSREKYYRLWGENISWMMKGIEQNQAQKIFTWLADEYFLSTIKQNILQRLKNHQKDGFLTILTSGSFQNLLLIIASRLNIDFIIGTELEVIGDRFSGKIVPPLCFGNQKVEKFKKLLSKKNLKVNFKESFAYSDGIFDLPLLKLVGHPVVVEPGDELLKIAQNKGWEII